uniref:Uncharacterized protein n=1 Tax=Florenciella parvula TaxID=236787 RepID=A0A7S2D2F3_9STRA|mmetsp:Transcript_8349/g.17705  ORF Transcript_8349/g.17705 Transcript_8349/m.17705 type:complete len:175 (+) Transcript_8349:3-527(+)
MKQLSTVQAFVLGALARAISTLIVYPYIRAKVENDKIFPTFTPALALSRRPTPNCNQIVILTHSPLHPQRTCPPAKMLTMLKDRASGPKALEGAKAAEGEEGGSNEGTDGPSDTVWGTLKPMLEEGNVGNLYRGVGPELFRGMLSSAVMLMVKERIYLVNRRLIMGEQMPKASA